MCYISLKMILIKEHNRKIKNQSIKKNKLVFSNFGLKSLSGGVLNCKHLDIIRRVCTKIFSKICKLFFRIFINQVLTKKTKNARMGKGAGKFDKFVYNIKQGQILVELLNITNITKVEKILKFILKKFSKKIIVIYNLFFRNRYV